ncbi:hypothetical protein [Janthinobacterium sp. MDT1-19]|uniref:hypothetical protein n=1 Tax=Janthinobacterium sp. MDT1-19 TaxID=1259339 RepID=UPI003F280FA0
MKARVVFSGNAIMTWSPATDSALPIWQRGTRTRLPTAISGNDGSAGACARVYACGTSSRAIGTASL